MNGGMNVPGAYSIDLSALQLNSQLHRPVISQSIMSLIRRGSVGVGLTILILMQFDADSRIHVTIM